MLDIRRIKENPEEVKRLLRAREIDCDTAVDLILDLVRTGLEAVGTFRRKLVVENVDILAQFGGTDPCKIALNYGRAWAGIGCLIPLLENAFTIKKRNIRAEISNDTQTVAVIAVLSLYIRMYRIFAIGFRYGWRVLRLFLRDRRRKKREQRALQQQAAAL